MTNSTTSMTRTLAKNPLHPEAPQNPASAPRAKAFQATGRWFGHTTLLLMIPGVTQTVSSPLGEYTI